MIMFDFSVWNIRLCRGNTEFIYVVCVALRRRMSDGLFPASQPHPTADSDTQWSLTAQSRFYDTCTVDQEQGWIFL